MISHPRTRVQAIKSKFENLGGENVVGKPAQLSKQVGAEVDSHRACNKENNYSSEKLSRNSESSDEWSPKVSPNTSYLYSKGDVKLNISESKKTLTRQTSDPGKKLHRSHAFRCDRSQKIVSPKRVGSCYGRSESGDFSLKMTEKKLSKDRLKKLGNLLEDQMRKEGFVTTNCEESLDCQNAEEAKVQSAPVNSIPDSEVPQHILDQYAKVIKPRRNEENQEKQDAMTDSGVSSETENLDDEKTSKVRRLLSQFEKNDSTDSEKSNLESMNEFSSSSDTIKLERKNPHVKITNTLKKALKQPLPAGPPPLKPPRTFASIPESPEKQKKETKKMLEKLEQVLQKREALNQSSAKNEYDIPEADLRGKKSETAPKKDGSPDENETLSVVKRPKEIHYLCTEILGITNRTSLPSPISLNNCFKSLNCAIVPTTNSTLSLPYTRLSTGSHISQNPCSCSSENLPKNHRLSTFSMDSCPKCQSSPNTDRFSTFLNEKCSKCQLNDEKHGFKCHLSCKCQETANFFVDNDEKEHIYDIPFISDDGVTVNKRTSNYGTLNHSKSLEDLRTNCNESDQKIYDIPCEISRPATPETPEQQASANISGESEKLIETSPKITEVIEKKRPNCESSPIITDVVLKATEKSPKSVQISPKVVEIRPDSPERRPLTQRPSKLEFQKLRQSFESGFQKTEDPNPKTVSPKIELRNPNAAPAKNVTDKKAIDNAEFTIEDTKTKVDKPPMKPKPVFVKNKMLMSKSSENLLEDVKSDRRDGRRYRRERDANAARISLPKKDSAQLDKDRDNLNRLMNEIYATVAAATDDMDKPGSFPTDGEDGSTSEDSVKLTRSLTEKRKNYVRRVSSKVAYLDQKNLRTKYRHQTSVCSYKSEIVDTNPYSTFRSWKSFRTSQKNLDKMADRLSMDSKVNLTDSTGNILSMRDDFDSSETIDKTSIDGKTGCVDIELPFEPRERGLFNVCLLVGFNYMTGQAYVKSVFPNQVQVPPHIENLIFPETLSAAAKGEWSADGKGAQCYSLVLTDERGERSYGYCRRVLPEGTSACLPLCYCIIGRYRAPGFYYKVLQEIESHHGSSEVEIHSILQQLFETDFPSPGEEVTVTHEATTDLTRTYNYDLRKSINLGDFSKSKTLPDMRRSLGKSDMNFRSHKSKKTDDDTVKSDSERVTDDKCKPDQSAVKNSSENSLNDSEKPVKDSDIAASEMFIRSESGKGRLRFYDLENSNGLRKGLLTVDRVRTKTIKRPIEPRVDEDNMSSLLDSMGAGLTIKVFSSLLLERKVLVIGDQLSQVSSCIEALQSALYPFVWQQPLISTIPAEIQKDVLEAPLPILAGMLKCGADIDVSGLSFEEGMLIDLTNQSKVLFYQGDESTILPASSYKTLKTSLQMESKKQDDAKMRNVMISEAFMRFFVDIIGDFWRFFAKGELKEGMLGKGDIVFDKESFIKSASSKQNQYFLEWFTETAMFNHFIQNMAAQYNNTMSPDSIHCMELVDTPLPDFYDLFQERVNTRRNTRKNSGSEKGYKLAVNKRVKLLKTKLKELVT